MDILFATSEAHPLIKTGGLADVAGGLPRAIRNLGNDVRLVLPAYPGALERIGSTRRLATMRIPDTDTSVHVLEGRLPGTKVRTYLIDHPDSFQRDGGPYTASDGNDWPDNAYRFATFCRAVAALALNPSILGWTPQVVHCNDWQTGLVAPLLSLAPKRPATVFTIHNLAYQGLFDWHTFLGLGLPQHWWNMHALEFHGSLSFIKGGLVFADHITTVSPTYAREICTPEFGYGLEGLLRHRSAALTGILNGVDYTIWNPSRDELIPANYNKRSMKGKEEDKAILQETYGLPVRPRVPLIAHVGRLVEQKGIDLLLEKLDDVLSHELQLVFLGSGDKQLERELLRASRLYPEKLGVRIGYDEPLAHLLEAGADMFLMPSRFEPCGLNQIYSLRYGTPPIVRHTGGLADTVTDTNPRTLEDGTASGFVFRAADPAALYAAIMRALETYARPREWHMVVQNAMRQDYSWSASAGKYLRLYQDLLTPGSDIA